jgi:hypothetical protein
MALAGVFLSFQIPANSPWLKVRVLNSGGLLLMFDLDADTY